MTPPVTCEMTGLVAVIRLQSPPVNALSQQVRRALYDAIARAGDDPDVSAIVLTGNSRFFSAGADIGEFRDENAGAMFAGRDPAEVIAVLEGLTKPAVAAIGGSALGGGLELAIGCHARIASRDAKLGLPEIGLGVIPGAGGTQRLPRLIGLEHAMQMMLSGKPVDAARAHALGLVDRVAESDLLSEAIELANSMVASGSIHRTSERPVRDADSMAVHVEAWRASARKAKASAIAVDHLLACARAAVSLPFSDAIKLERTCFLDCNRSEAAAGLQHAFFATRQAAKTPSQYAGSTPRLVERVAIVGGGTMGRGIAMAFANAGIDVTIVEMDAQRAAAAVETIRDEYQGLAASGRLDPAQAERRAAIIHAAEDFDAVRGADLVIEAVFENLEIKRDVCRRLGQACRPGAIIASNTSTLDIDFLARESGRAQDFVGLHFFSPAHVMRLVEVIRGKDTNGEVLATSMELVRRLGKNAVVSGVCYGFIGNRMLEPYLRETESLLLEGCTPAQIDAAIEGFGMAMGPCRMMDLAGVDVVAKVVEERGKQGQLPADPLYRIVCRELAVLGRFGQKSGNGFYAYQGRRAVEDPGAIESIRALAARHQVAQRTAVEAQEIVERCLLPLINEGFRIVEEGIAYRESDVDVVWLSGYGFPSERGGPLFYARRNGLRAIGERLTAYAAHAGDPYGYWTPARTIHEALEIDSGIGKEAMA